MSYSLLAHLYPYIKGSQEDIATYALQYLLSNSTHLNSAFTKQMADHMDIELDETLQYLCQVTGESEEQERPDMVGLDSNGKEVILCEMKFYATLTANQPGTYLQRLKNEGGKGLMFVCPKARRTNLWVKLKELCDEMSVTPINEHCIDADGIRLAIITWGEIIDLLKLVASSVDVAFTPDIIQLEGYCNQLDSDAFIPFSAEDLSAEMAKKGERYYQIVDEIIELLCANKDFETSKKGLKATGYRKGYTRSLYIDEFTVTINFDRDLWKNPKTVECPFWIAFRDHEWQQTEQICEKLKLFPEQHKEYFWNMTFLPLIPLQNATFSEVCEDIMGQILKYFTLIRDTIN